MWKRILLYKRIVVNLCECKIVFISDQHFCKKFVVHSSLTIYHHITIYTLSERFPKREEVLHKQSDTNSKNFAFPVNQ